ncbi:MAG TPA: carboxypeptidase regulatory-like domain-containing protein, partial [Gemmatimonadaceae bacterium]|nr:carboxypeptidase regulatory-like domain-containing protein [Gemmatimonadaceae bacterium]
MTLATAAAVVIALPNLARAQVAPPAKPAAGGFTTLQGFVMDSVHNMPLADAKVSIEGTPHFGTTNADGHYTIDSIPPGSHHVIVEHPVLDTLGVQMRTPAYPFAAGESRNLDLAIPTAERLATALCTSAQRMRGPAAMIGFVRDPDTRAPAIGSKVQL